MIAHTTRRLALRLLVALPLLAALLLPARGPAQANPPWTASLALSPTTQHSFFPDIAYDAQGRAHVVFARTLDFRARQITYRRKSAGTWGTANSGLFSTLYYADRPRLSTTSLDGQVKVGLVVKGDEVNPSPNASGIYYAESLDGGASWAAAKKISGEGAHEPDVVLDDTGAPHVIFTQLIGGMLHIAYTTRVDGVWQAPVQLSGGIDTKYNNYAVLEYTRDSQGTLVLHALFMGEVNPGGELLKSIFYTRKVGAAGWSTPKQLMSSSADQPDLESDHRGALYATWHAYTSTWSHEPYVSTSANHGRTWSAPAAVGLKSGDLGSRPSIGLSVVGDLAVAFDSNAPGNIDIATAYRAAGAAAWSPADWISLQNGLAKEVEVAGGITELGAIWHEVPAANMQIFFSARPTSSSVTGRPGLGGASHTSATSSLPVSFEAVYGAPDQVRYSWDAPPDSAPFITYTNPLTLTAPAGFPAGLSATTCAPHTLYTQLRSSVTGQRQPMAGSASIVFDQGVQTTAMIMSPTAPGAPTPPTSTATLAPASAGRPDMLRSPAYVYQLTPEPSPCAGLASYRSPDGSGAAADPPHLDGGGAPVWVTLDPTLAGLGPEAGPDTYHEGPITATLHVTDTLGNARVLTRTLFYDDDAPVVGQAITPALDIANDDGLSATAILSWTASVADDYSTSAGLDPDKGYWGVWVLVLNPAAHATALQDGGVDATDFVSYGAQVVAVPPNATSASVRLISRTNTAVGATAGERFIYLLFLDGAGNPSATMLAGEATVTAAAEETYLYLPLLDWAP